MPPDLDATIQGWLDARDRHADLAHQNEAMPGAEAEQYGFADLDATSVVDLLNKVDGRTVQTAGGPWVLHTQVATTDADVNAGIGVVIHFIEPGILVRVAHAVATPSMVYFLLVFGLACIAFEITQPGFGFAGFAGVFLTALGVYGLTVAVPVVAVVRADAGGHRRDGARRADAPIRRADLWRAGGVRGRLLPRVRRRGRRRSGSRRG